MSFRSSCRVRLADIMKSMSFRLFLTLLAVALWSVAAFAQTSPTPVSVAAQTTASAARQTTSTPPAPNDKPKTTSAANGQQSSTSDDESVATIRKTVNDVNVFLPVTDKQGRYVKDLKRADFKVIDDPKPADDVKDCRNQTALPLQV